MNASGFRYVIAALIAGIVIALSPAAPAAEAGVKSAVYEVDVRGAYVGLLVTGSEGGSCWSAPLVIGDKPVGATAIAC